MARWEGNRFPRLSATSFTSVFIHVKARCSVFYQTSIRSKSGRDLGSRLSDSGDVKGTVSSRLEPTLAWTIGSTCNGGLPRLSPGCSIGKTHFKMQGENSRSATVLDIRNSGNGLYCTCEASPLPSLQTLHSTVFVLYQRNNERKKVPRKRLAKVEEIGGCAAFLSDASNFMVGTQLVVDGGFTIQ
jgi:hypothetical protein